MKKKFLFAILFCCLSNPFFLNAQTHASVNSSSQPIWGPVGYDLAENYYMPEIESYYNVRSRKYMFLINGKWVTSSTLPTRYSNFDLYHGYKVVINEKNPYLRFNKHRVKYISYWNKHNQEPIRDSREVKYYVNENHPKHNDWKNNANSKKERREN